MYPSPGIYDKINYIALILVYVFNILNFKKKTKVIGRFTDFFVKSNNKSEKLNTARVIFILIEIVLISFAQYQLSSVNSIFGSLVGTGANYFGKLIFAPFSIAFFCLLLGIDVFRQMDIITPAFPLALAVSKFACFRTGCCGGIVCSYGLYNHSSKQTEFPVQLVEMALAALIFIFLMFWQKKAKEGTMFPTYLILYSSTRFFSEFLRGEENVFFFLKSYHILCLFGIAAGIFLLFFIKKYKERIRRFYGDYFDAAEDILTDMEIRLGIKNKDAIVHHNKKKKKKSTVPSRALALEKAQKNSAMKKWIIIWTIGLIGQIGWNVEGTWFNTFVYDKIDKNPSIITPMLILSAFATTVSILLFGTLTDRTGRRRTLVSSGFVLWGILFICFGLTQFIAGFNLTLGIVSIVFLDMLLSFFGSMSVDVGYGTWLTDIMNDNNRGQISGAIAVQVVLGSLLGNVLGGYIVGSSNNYLRLFIVIGSAFCIFGSAAAFLFDKKDDVKPFVSGTFTQQFLSVFKLKALSNNKEFFLVNIAVAIFFTGYNTYFPHLGNLLTQYLHYSSFQMGIIVAIPMIFSMLVTIPVSKYINERKYIALGFISIVLGLVGILSVHRITPEDIDPNKTFNLRIFSAIFLVGISYIIMLQSTKAWSKNLLPQDSKGQYEGIWAIFFALIPAIFGSNIGEWVIKNNGEALFDAYNKRYAYIPNGKVFLVGAIISVFSFIPIVIAKKYSDRSNKLSAQKNEK